MGEPLVTLRCWYRFEAAHFLPYVPDGHKCRSLHGHSYRVEVAITDNIGGAASGRRRGMVLDKEKIDAMMQKPISILDHSILNELAGAGHFAWLKNPTAENIARHIFNSLPRKGFRCHELRITVWEGEELSATYWGSSDEWTATITTPEPTKYTKPE